MKTLAQRIALFLAGTALITSCSRPYATVQRTPAERFVAKTETVQAIAPAQAEAPVVVAAPVATPEVVTPIATPEAASVQTQLTEAVASNKAVMADKRVQKQMAKINAALASSSQNATMTPTAGATAKKMNLLERTMVKKIDKKIKQQMSPEKPMAKSLLTLGAIIGIIGLVLLLLNVAAPLGLIALIVGLVLILVDLLR
ncbi:MAG: hypothetical protein EAZ91_03390 [Cytophagales bacterium]|nr:MAG: hypothetical protein EAZ91_03390 [Cytophagales bacterium]